jgi:hypothetical protein
LCQRWLANNNQIERLPSVEGEYHSMPFREDVEHYDDSCPFHSKISP